MCHQSQRGPLLREALARSSNKETILAFILGNLFANSERLLSLAPFALIVHLSPKNWEETGFEDKVDTIEVDGSMIGIISDRDFGECHPSPAWAVWLRGIYFPCGSKPIAADLLIMEFGRNQGSVWHTELLGKSLMREKKVLCFEASLELFSY